MLGQAALRGRGRQQIRHHTHFSTPANGERTSLMLHWYSFTGRWCRARLARSTPFGRGDHRSAAARPRPICRSRRAAIPCRGDSAVNVLTSSWRQRRLSDEHQRCLSSRRRAPPARGRAMADGPCTFRHPKALHVNVSMWDTTCGCWARAGAPRERRGSVGRRAAPERDR
jgi:hypothetical protein